MYQHCVEMVMKVLIAVLRFLISLPSFHTFFHICSERRISSRESKGTGFKQLEIHGGHMKEASAFRNGWRTERRKRGKFLPVLLVSRNYTVNLMGDLVKFILRKYYLHLKILAKVCKNCIFCSSSHVFLSEQTTDLLILCCSITYIFRIGVYMPASVAYHFWFRIL